MTLAEPSNLYVRALILSLGRFYAVPSKVFLRAKKLEPEWALDRRVLGRAWAMLRPFGILSERTSARNGHGGVVWEVHHEHVFPFLALMETLPYHADAAVYSTLGYPGPGARAPRKPTRQPKEESPHAG